MFLLGFLLLSLQNKYGNITNNHLESKVTYLETSGLKSHPWIKWRMKDYSETTELEQTLLSDSFIGFFFHSRRDQMNSGRGWELGPRAQSRKWSVMVCFSAMPTEHPGELAPGGYAVGQNDLTLWKVSSPMDWFIRDIEARREWKRKMDETNQILFAPGRAGKINNNQKFVLFFKNFFQRIFLMWTIF